MPVTQDRIKLKLALWNATTYRDGQDDPGMMPMKRSPQAYLPDTAGIA